MMPVFCERVRSLMWSELQLYLSPMLTNAWDLLPSGEYVWRPPPQSAVARLKRAQSGQAVEGEDNAPAVPATTVWQIMMDASLAADAGY